MNRLALPFVTLLALAVTFLPTLAPAASATNRFHFRLPVPAAYRLDADQAQTLAATSKVPWLKAWPEDGSTNSVELGSRIVLQLNSPTDLKRLIAGSGLELSRTVSSNLFILQAPEAWTALRQAHRLAALPEVAASYSVMQRQGVLNDLYAPRSNDTFFFPYFYTGLGQQIDALWFLENKDADGNRLGVDLNVLAAWPLGRGQGVTVAVVDTGLEMNHSELAARVAGAPHFNFRDQNTNATPFGGSQSDPLRDFWTHGTSVGGLIAAEGNNNRGMVGVAPLAHLAGWAIFNTNGSLVSDEVLMDMYQYGSNTVAIQNHSWGGGNYTKVQTGPAALEQTGIANAITLGRNGLGTIFVRSAGNDRTLLASAEDDGYVNDPQVIGVAAVSKTGRATDYSEPGACLLVGAPGGDGDGVNGKQRLFTLDLVGPNRGVNSGIYYGGDMADYRWGIQGFSGTSASAPLVSGVAALMLSVNPNLGYRDVQQILALSARQWDLTDPDIVTNGAGLWVSHNSGFGVPDAGQAVRLAQMWSNRPPLTTLSMTDSRALAIPEDGLRIEVSGVGVPPALTSLYGRPDFGPHPDSPTRALPLVDVGLATNAIALNLTNKGVLIARGANTFEQKINYAAQAGAAFAIVYNYPGDDSLLGMIGTDYTPIPAVFVGNSDGEALKALFQTNISALARIRLQSAERVFHVSSPLLCEHVGVRVQADYPIRGDLRITLLSPQGTRSVLQHFNDDTNSGPANWTYWSTHHLLESSVGDWKVAVTDEGAGNTGIVYSVSLIIRGTQIFDTDHDGLDDVWEIAHFGSLSFGPQDDPDGDGFSNAREQMMGTNPLAPDLPFKLDLTPWQVWGNQRMRLSWPTIPASAYEIWGGTNVNALSLITNLPGRFPVTEWFTPSAPSRQFFRVRAVP